MPFFFKLSEMYLPNNSIDPAWVNAFSDVMSDVILNCNRSSRNKNESISILFFDLSSIDVLHKENHTGIRGTDLFKYEYVVNESVDESHIQYMDAEADKDVEYDSFDRTHDVDDVIEYITKWHRYFTRNRNVNNIYFHVTCERNANNIERNGLYSQRYFSDKNHLRMGDYDKAGGKNKSKNKSKSRKNKSKNKSKSRKSNMFL